MNFLQAVLSTDSEHILAEKLAESTSQVAQAMTIQVLQADDGSKYYFNTATQETMWEKPAQLEALETTMQEMADAAKVQQEVRCCLPSRDRVS